MADWQTIARRAARRWRLDPNVFVRQMGVEAGGQDLTSPAGAQGPAQIMPATARAWGVRDVHDIHEAYDKAAQHMAGYVREYGSIKDALIAYNAGPGAIGKPLPGETQRYIANILGGGHQPTTAPAAPQAAGPPAAAEAPGRGALIASFLQNKSSDPLDLALAIRQLAPAATPSRAQQPAGPPAAAGGVATFDGKPVATWMVPALKYARANGWTGTITSGVRTRAEQAALYRNRASNPYPVAKPGTSNHEIENGGAVDVSDPGGLARALRAYRGRRLIQGTAINDPVHFSATGR